MNGIGEALRLAREHRGLAIGQVSQDTRISPQFLQALEDEDFEALPAPVYARGFLRSYANYLHLDPQPLLEALSNRGKPLPPGPDEFVEVRAGEGRPDPFAQRPRSAPMVRAAPAYRGPFPEAVEVHRAPRQGVLSDRETIYHDGSAGLRIMAILAAVAMGLVVMTVGALAFRGGDDGTTPGGVRDDGDGPEANTIIPVGTQGTGGEGETVPPGSPGTGETPSATGTTGAGSGTPAATTGPGTPTATTAGAATAGPTATATQRPPTSTPKPPTAAPTATATPIVHPLGYAECSGGPHDFEGCGGLPFTVVCAPNGWFLDVGSNSNSGGWAVVVVDEAAFRERGWSSVDHAC